MNKKKSSNAALTSNKSTNELYYCHIWWRWFIIQLKLVKKSLYEKTENKVTEIKLTLHYGQLGHEMQTFFK